MILVDTSVWIDHYRNGNETLAELLTDGQVLSHAFVRGELACGNLKDRDETLRFHGSLPQSVRVHDDEVIASLARGASPDAALDGRTFICSPRRSSRRIRGFGRATNNWQMRLTSLGWHSSTGPELSGGEEQVGPQIRLFSDFNDYAESAKAAEFHHHRDGEAPRRSCAALSITDIVSCA